MQLQQFNSIQPKDIHPKQSLSAVTTLFNNIFVVLLFVLNILSYSYLNSNLIYSDFSFFTILLIDAFYLAFGVCITLYVYYYLALYKYLNNQGIGKMVQFNVAFLSALKNIYYFLFPFLYLTLLLFLVHIAFLDLYLYFEDSLGVLTKFLAFVNYFPLVFIFLIFIPHAGLWINSVVLKRFSHEYRCVLYEDQIKYFQAKSFNFSHKEVLKYLVFNFLSILLAYFIVILLVTIFSFLCTQILYSEYFSQYKLVLSEPWINLLQKLPFLFAIYSVLLFVTKFYNREDF